MSLRTEPTQPHNLAQRFSGRLQRTFLLVVIPLTVIPVVIVGIFGYQRSRTLLTDQVNALLDINVHILADEIESWVTTGKIRLDAAVRNITFQENMDLALATRGVGGSAYEKARDDVFVSLQELNKKAGNIVFRDFFVISTSGDILIASQDAWEGVHLADDAYRSLRTNEITSMAIYGPAPLADDRLMIFIHVPYQPANPSILHVVGIISPLTLQTIVDSATRFHPDAQSYLIASESEFIGIDIYQKNLQLQQPSNDQIQALASLIAAPPEDDYEPVLVQDFNLTKTLADYVWLPSLQIGLVYALPEATALTQLGALAPFILLTFGFLVVTLITVIGFSTQRLVKPLQDITETTQQFAQGNLDQRVPITRSDELGLLSYSVNQMAAELSNLYSSLEAQVQERTHALEARSAQLEATAQVAREASAIRDLGTLLMRSTELIPQYFGFYHAGIFLIDEHNKFAVLQAANSEGGRRMLARGHKLGVGRAGVVGRCAETGAPRIALDVGEDRYFFDNPDLPETRSEMALPLKAQNRVIGVLDVQSTEPGAFSREDIEVLQVLADLIALAIENARLLEQSQQTVQELQSQYSDQVSEAWRQRLGTETNAYHFDRIRVTPASQEQIAALRSDEQDKIQIEADGSQLLHIPITLRGQRLGAITLRRDPNEPAWTLEDRDLASESTTQIAVALENARLLEESLRRARHEQTVGEISSRIARSFDIESLLKNTVQELGRLPHVTDVSVHIKPSDDKQ